MRVTLAQLGSVPLWLEIPETAAEQSLGLQGRQGLTEHQGMYFPGPVVLEMKQVTFPIDMVFLRDNRVAVIVGPIAPGTQTRWSIDGSGAVELAGGWSARHGLQVGTPLILR